MSQVEGNRRLLTESKVWVVKIGSSLLTDNGKGLNNEAMAAWASQIAVLHDLGIQIVLVSSGAVAEGVSRLGLAGRPSAVNEQQAAAAVGQMGLIQAYESCFKKYGKQTAQILLTHDDLSNRTRYLNASSTLNVLLKMKVIPIVNENDTVVTDEICFGDNDTLAALVANLINADALVILTDQEGLFDSDPRNNQSAVLISEASSNDESLMQAAGESHGLLGKGGMQTKITAAQLASRSGTLTAIIHGNRENVLLELQQGQNLGTLLVPEEKPIAARKQWLASHLQVCGTLVLDQGAVEVLKHSGKSLLPVGISALSGVFARGDMVACVNHQGLVIARGLVNYNSSEIDKIKGKPSENIVAILGYDGEHEVIHRNNLVLL